MTPFNAEIHFPMIKAAVKVGMRSSPSKGPRYQIGKVLRAQRISTPESEVIDALIDIATYQLVEEIKSKGNRIPSVISA